MARRPRILVLYWSPTGLRPAIRHHLEVLKYGPQKPRVLYYNLAKSADRATTHDLMKAQTPWWRFVRFDAAILHTTVLCLRWLDYFPFYQWQLRWLKDHPCRKIAFPQDEYDHAHVLDDWLCALGVSDVFTNFPARDRTLLYPLLSGRARFHECFTGYIDPQTAASLAGRLLPAPARPRDLVYRARHLPYSFGRYGRLKSDIAAIVAEGARRHGLVCDLSTRLEDEIESDAWFDFLASSRAVLGVESGSCVLDSRGQILAQIEWMKQQNPQITFEEVCRRLPEGWDDYGFFALGPRHFEAVITRTAQVLIEGRYSDVLVPDRHYIPLKRDFSNLDEVLEKVKDTALLERLTSNAYQDIYESGRYTYARLAEKLDEVLRAPGAVRGGWFRIPFSGARCLIALRRRVRARCQRIASRPRQIARLYALGCEAVRKWRCSLRFVLGRGPLRRTWRRGLLTRPLRKSGSAGLLFKDLAKLAVLEDYLRAPAGEAPRIVPTLDGQGKLLLVSVPATEPAGAGPGRAPLAQALADRALTHITWDHRRVGTFLRCSFKGRPVQLYLGGDGIHHFRGLSELARHRPECVRSLLWELLRGPEASQQAA